MGIQGLIPFLEKSSRPINISHFSGCTVAIDAYCWLHKGAFGCADKLARGDNTDVYVNYCMKYVNMLLSHNIKPILVFDGRHLPAKADTEKKRRHNREVNRRRAAELLRQDKPNEARTFLQRCVDVTHTMALEVMQECRKRNVDCITAPYEADAQLAYLNINNIAHIVITEDSDLLLFGCTKVMFKLDLNGNGLLVDQENLHLAMGVSKGCFSMDKFRYMCILSGCDYLPSLPKIGLAKACRFIKSTVDPDIHRALSRLGGHLNMNIEVPLEYRNKFMEADAMFRYQPVFDPLTRRLLPLTPLPQEVPPNTLLTKETLTTEQQLDLALGNLDPFTLKKVDDWNPDKAQNTGGRTNSWNVNAAAPSKSIWSADFKPKGLVIEKPDPCKVKRTSTSGKVLEHNVDIPKLPIKRPLHETEEELKALREQFGPSPNPSKKPCLIPDGEDILELLDKPDLTPPKSEVSSPEMLGSPKKPQTNPFSKTTPTSGNKFGGLSKLAQFRKTIVSENNIVQSRYFNSSHNPPVNKQDDTKPDTTTTLKDVSNVTEKQITNYKPDLKNIEKLSDDRISSLMQEQTEDINEDGGTINHSKEKENISEDSVKSKHESAFRWKRSIADMFGLKKISVSSSPAVGNKFASPSKHEPNSEEKPSSFENSHSAEQKNKPASRNPFAKVIQDEDCILQLGSQGSMLSKDSDSDILTPNSSNSQESTCSMSNTTPRTQIKVGLSKKQTKGCQKSLLTMFAFKPKAKLQR